jgi:hypothetical protein
MTRAHASRLFLAAMMVAAGSAHAEDKAAAAALFDQGVALMEKKDYPAACAKLKDSLAASAGIGTMLYLADCYEQRGLTASAWAQFRQAAALASEKGDPREKVARRRVEALEPKLAYLTIHVKARASGLTVTRDDAPFSEASWGVAVPIDPGKHVVVANATRKKTWKSDVSIGAATRVEVSVPPLEDVPIAAQPPPTPPVQNTQKEDPATGDNQRLIGIIVGGAGIVALGVGGYFGLRAQSKLDESNADNHCRPPNDICDATGLALRQDAGDAATISTVGVIVGVVMIASGVVLYLTAPSAPARSARRWNTLTF